MKLSIFIGIYLICAITNTCYSQVVIRGVIIDSNNNDVTLFEPINGFYNGELGGAESLVALDRNGFFQKTLELQQPIMLCLQIGLRPINFFAEPGDTIEMEINLNQFTDYEPNGGIIFTGKNAKGNEYFNVFNFNPGRKIGRFKAIVEDSLHLWRNFKFETIDYGTAKITDDFDTLLNKGEITKKFYDILVPSIKSLLISQEIRDLLVSQKNMAFSDALALAERIYNRYPVSEYMMKKSPFGRSIASFFFLIRASQHYPSYYLSDSMVVVNGRKLFVNSNLVSWLYAPMEIQEVLWPMSLIRLKSLFADSYGKRDVETFLTLHPNSPVRKYLQPPYFDDHELKSLEVDSSSIHFITDSVTAKFGELMKKYFSGEKVFVDFWASWCLPCKEEFAFNTTVDDFCKRNGIRKLYVSFDLPSNENVMRKNIYSYELKGYHIRVSNKLFDDLVTVFYPDGQISLPRYILVDENGVIVNARAPRPSGGNQLFTEMKKDFKLNN